MFKFRTRKRWWWLGAIATALVVSLTAILMRPVLEREVRTRIETEAVRHGAVARVGVVHVGVWPLLRLQGFDLDPTVFGPAPGAAVEHAARERGLLARIGQNFVVFAPPLTVTEDALAEMIKRLEGSLLAVAAQTTVAAAD